MTKHLKYTQLQIENSSSLLLPMIIGFVLANFLPIIESLVQVQMTIKSSFGMSMIRKD